MILRGLKNGAWKCVAAAVAATLTLLPAPGQCQEYSSFVQILIERAKPSKPKPCPAACTSPCCPMGVCTGAARMPCCPVAVTNSACGTACQSGVARCESNSYHSVCG